MFVKTNKCHNDYVSNLRILATPNGIIANDPLSDERKVQYQIENIFILDMGSPKRTVSFVPNQSSVTLA